MKRVSKGLIAATLLTAAGITVRGSSHREALAILNEPCAGSTETMKVTRIEGSDDGDDWRDDDAVVLGKNLPVLPNNHGPQTDRLIYHLGQFKGYDSGDPTSREVGLYDQPFVDTFIHDLTNGGRIIAGQFDDPYQLDEKGIFDLVNLASSDLGGIPGARRPPAKDVFTGFNIFSIALEVPISDVFPHGIPHNGQLQADSTDSLLRVWASISRQKTQTVDTSNIITGLKGSGPFVQVGRNALPLFNAGLVGTQRQTLYLHSSPLHDVTNFGADILFPVLVRDAEALGIYAALGVPPATVATLKGPRVDIIKAINLNRSEEHTSELQSPCNLVCRLLLEKKKKKKKMRKQQEQQR